MTAHAHLSTWEVEPEEFKASLRLYSGRAHPWPLVVVRPGFCGNIFVPRQSSAKLHGNVKRILPRTEEGAVLFKVSVPALLGCMRWGAGSAHRVGVCRRDLTSVGPRATLSKQLF